MCLYLPRDQLRVRHTVKAIRPRLILLDPFVRLHRAEENDSGEVSALLGYLQEIQRESETAVLVFNHARKNGASAHAPGQGLRGSGDLHAWVDSNLYLNRRRQVPVRRTDPGMTVDHGRKPGQPACRPGLGAQRRTPPLSHRSPLRGKLLRH
jgi:hypothetical protein